MPKTLSLLLVLGACAGLEDAQPADSAAWSADQLPPPTFPLELSGTLEYDFAGRPFNATFTLYDDGTVDATFAISPFEGTWSAAGNMVTLDMPLLGIITGRPVRGCIVGRSRQPVPAAYGSANLMTLSWDLCLVP
jgi:hypothetical protein